MPQEFLLFDVLGSRRLFSPNWNVAFLWGFLAYATFFCAEFAKLSRRFTVFSFSCRFQALQPFFPEQEGMAPFFSPRSTSSLPSAAFFSPFSKEA